MNNVDNAVNMLISSVKESAVYIEYQKQLEEITKYPELKRQIDEFRARSFQLQNSAEFSFDKLEQLEEEYDGFCENSMVADFFSAELAFCRMMQEISNRITEAIEFS